MFHSPSRSDIHRSEWADGRQVAPTRRAVNVSSVLLLIGISILAVFSVAMAVTNDRAADHAEHNAHSANLSKVALDALVTEEARADGVIEVDDAESRREYIDANAAVDTAIEELHRAHPIDGVDELRAWHAGYGLAVSEMFERYAGRPTGGADAFESAYVDPFFDPLHFALIAIQKDNIEAAQAAMLSIAEKQQLLLFATPVLFGATLALIALFVVKLGRSRRQIERQADQNSYQSLHDELTGLPNRTLLHVTSAEAVARAAASGTQMALMLIDLDRFKEINDTLGHHCGDLVLEAVSQRLRAAVRATDTVARLGGDEFAVLLPRVNDVAAAVEVARKIHLALTDSVDADGVSLDVDASIGIAVSGEHGDDVATLLQHADIAMYRAKGDDLGVCVYDDSQNDHSREQLGLLGELRHALDNGELILHFQPKLDLKTFDFCGAEALVRWRHPTRGLIAPGSFVPAAERTAIIRPLTRYVIDAALAECQRWRDEGKDLRVAVNVSARNLLDAEFPSDVADLLDKWSLPSSCLMLEVTESAIMAEPMKAEAMLVRFAELGIELAIDDFGAGYTSLAHLRSLPVQELKIDQSLVGRMAVSAKDALIVGAMIDLAHNLGLRTVAEGVDDACTLDRLRRMGCDIAQGFHIALPMTGAQLTQWRTDWETASLLLRHA